MWFDVPVAVLVTLTSAPTTTAPDGSVTRPDRGAVSAWLHPIPQQSKQINESRMLIVLKTPFGTPHRRLHRQCHRAPDPDRQSDRSHFRFPWNTGQGLQGFPWRPDRPR